MRADQVSLLLLARPLTNPVLDESPGSENVKAFVQDLEVLVNAGYEPKRAAASVYGSQKGKIKEFLRGRLDLTAITIAAITKLVEDEFGDDGDEQLMEALVICFAEACKKTESIRDFLRRYDTARETIKKSVVIPDKVYSLMCLQGLKVRDPPRHPSGALQCLPSSDERDHREIPWNIDEERPRLLGGEQEKVALELRS